MNIKTNKIYLIIKPEGWTSFDVVAKIRSELKNNLNANSQQPVTKAEYRVGHAGTLDPFATGLLILLTGSETKNQSQYMKMDKVYETTFVLGKISSTDDKTGKIESTNFNKEISIEEIKNTLNNFTGEIKQIPPKYSAIKVDGKRAYKLARHDKEFELNPRKVKINGITLTEYKYPKVSLKIACSSGTYIRALARDFGDRLGCGAYVESLKRTRIGSFTLEDAVSLPDIIK